MCMIEFGTIRLKRVIFLLQVVHSLEKLIILVKKE